jgi:hypothetical protein
MGLSAVERAYI